jgi:hypothetical protein
MKKPTPPKETAPLPVNRVAKALTDLVADINDRASKAPSLLGITLGDVFTAAEAALEATNVPLVMPKDRTTGLANFVRMIIDELDNGDLTAARYLAIDLWNDIGTTYVVK